ncbi:uncharacterized protein LOC144096668 [Amblyomma americanum]
MAGGGRRQRPVPSANNERMKRPGEGKKGSGAEERSHACRRERKRRRQRRWAASRRRKGSPPPRLARWQAVIVQTQFLCVRYQELCLDIRACHWSHRCGVCRSPATLARCGPASGTSRGRTPTGRLAGK